MSLKHTVKSCIFIFLLTASSFCQRGEKPVFDANNPQAKGVILTFNRWPNDREQAVILEKLTDAGLKKKSEIQRFKVWIFEWPEWRTGTEAEELCREFSTLSFMDYCEPDYLTSPSS